MSINTKLEGKNVLITAGGQGIGESITRHFIDSGANVAIHYFSSAETANQLMEYAKTKGLKAVDCLINNCFLVFFVISYHSPVHSTLDVTETNTILPTHFILSPCSVIFFINEILRCNPFNPAWTNVIRTSTKSDLSALHRPLT